MELQFLQSLDPRNWWLLVRLDLSVFDLTEHSLVLETSPEHTSGKRLQASVLIEAVT